MDSEFGLYELITGFKKKVVFLYSKKVIIFVFSVLGFFFGLTYAYFQKPKYNATISFALEDEKSSNAAGLSSALGIASSLGLDLSSGAGGAFTGLNLMELMKSRRIVESALLNKIDYGKRVITLADLFIENQNIKTTILHNNQEKKVTFPVNLKRENFEKAQDSILGILYYKIINTSEDGILTVFQKDKKISILNINVLSENELFSKAFSEAIANETSDFYIETKSKKAKLNVSILSRQVDSIRNELNLAISGVATLTDNIYNLNPSLNVKRIPTTKKQVDIQANTAILTQLVTNLELAKVTLLKETPLIQIIDKPILPLKVQKAGIIKFSILGFLLSFILIILVLLGNDTIKKVLKEKTN